MRNGIVDAGPNTKLTIERRGQIVLIGMNRPYIQNRIDPETFQALAESYYQYDHDSSLRVAVLFGHGENFSRGQHCFPPILPSIPPKPTLCPYWMLSLARSFTRETFRRDEKLKLKGVRRCIRVDDPCEHD